MSEAPETDALMDVWRKNVNEWVAANPTRKLERDEAREQSAKLRDIADRAINAIDDQFRCVEQGIWITNKLKQQLRAKLDQLAVETT